MEDELGSGTELTILKEIHAGLSLAATRILLTSTPRDVTLLSKYAGALMLDTPGREIPK